jgi:hypothetical protein
VQQLSLLAPQLERPAPLVWQLGSDATQVPLTHCPDAHAVAFCHVPVEPHVCGCMLDAHCICPGAHAPWQVPFTHVWLVHATESGTHAPIVLHVAGVFDAHFVSFGLHVTQAPFKHTGVFPVHAPGQPPSPVPDADSATSGSAPSSSGAGASGPAGASKEAS